MFVGQVKYLQDQKNLRLMRHSAWTKTACFVQPYLLASHYVLARV